MHKIKDGEVFVFGSNLAGRHGKGAALEAVRHHGAIYGRGIGRQGMSYAIPTKDGKLKTLPLDIIRGVALEFLMYAYENKDTKFFLTRVGCGLAGYSDEQIAPLFNQCPANVRIPPEWEGLVTRA